MRHPGAARRGIDRAISSSRRQPNGPLMRRDASGSIAALTRTRIAGETGTHVAVVSSRRPSRDLSRHRLRSRRDPESGSRRSTMPRPRKRLFAADRSHRSKPRPQDLRTSRPHLLLYLNDLALWRSPSIRPPSSRRASRRSWDCKQGAARIGQLFATATNDVLIYGAPGTRASRAAMADARRQAGGIDERADRCVGPADRARWHAVRRDGDRSPAAHARCVHPHRIAAGADAALAVDRRATRAASGRRTDFESRGPASAARSCCAAPARCCPSRRSPRSIRRCKCGTGRAMHDRC